MRTRAVRFSLLVAGVCGIAAVSLLLAGFLEGGAGAQIELTDEEVYTAAEEELASGAVQTWSVDATAAEVWDFAELYRERAEAAESFSDDATADTYWTLAADAADVYLAAPDGDAERADAYMLAHDALSAQSGPEIALDDLETRLAEIWADLPAHADRHELTTELQRRAVAARKAHAWGAEDRYAALTRGRAIALIAEAPYHPAVAHLTELYHTAIPGAAPTEPGLMNSIKLGDTLTDETPETRAAVDELVAAIDANPGGILEFCGAYSAGYAEEIILGNRAAGQALYARSLAVLDSGVVDDVLADPELDHAGLVRIQMLVAHCYYEARRKDAARLQYEHFKRVFPEETDQIPHADYGLMRLRHGDPEMTHEDRVAMSREFITAHPTHHLAWEIAERRGPEYAARYRFQDAAEVWLAMASANPEPRLAVLAYRSGIGVLIEHERLDTAAALSRDFLAKATHPEVAAGALYHSAAIPLARGDTDAARAVYSQVLTDYPDSNYAAAAQLGLDALDAEAR